MSRRRFLGSTDISTVCSLLNNYNVPTKIPNCVHLHQIKQQDDLVLIELGTLLTGDECDAIVNNLETKEFEKMSNKYDHEVRNNSRLVAIDDRLGRTLWRRLKFGHKLSKLIQHTKPLGFNVQGEWEMSGVNPAMRINKYQRGDFFAPHKDAQYAPNGDERSLFSLIIYLNDDYEKGQTKFYFPKVNKKADIKGLTIKEEIKAYGGLQKGYECITIKPKKGYAVLFTHNLLHEATVPNTAHSAERIVLRSDVLVKRKDKPLGFAVCAEEQEDYLACLNFFREAQQGELNSNPKSSDLSAIGNLYERSLSIRYCYPRLLEQKLQQSMDIGDEQKPLFNQLPIETWLHVFRFLDEAAVQNLIFAYPEFQLLKIAWDAQEKRKFLNDPSKEKFIPNIHTQFGSRTLFRFTDSKFFYQHIDQCCRVAAVYAFFLLGHGPDATTYTIRYDQDTQEVCEVEMEKLFSDVFYNRNCYGSLYRVEQKDEKERRPKVDFDHSVDRTYMTNRHGSQFLGQDLLPRLYLRIKAIPAEDSEEEDSEEEDIDYSEPPPNEEEDIDYSEPPPNEEEVRGYQRVNALSDSLEQLVGMDYDDDETASHYEKDDVLGFREQLIEQSNQDSGASICRILSGEDFTISDYHRCCLGPYNNAAVLEDLIHVYNHLVFDFDTHQLTVEQLSDENTNNTYPLQFLCKHFRKSQQSNSEDISILNYRVNIEKLAQVTKGFNHASCWCGLGTAEVDQFSFLDYTYLSSVNLAVIQDGEGVFVLAKYDGIAAF